MTSLVSPYGVLQTTWSKNSLVLNDLQMYEFWTTQEEVVHPPHVINKTTDSHLDKNTLGVIHLNTPKSVPIYWWPLKGLNVIFYPPRNLFTLILLKGSSICGVLLAWTILLWKLNFNAELKILKKVLHCRKKWEQN